MNRPIRNLFVVVMLMFALLIGATSWWTVVRADQLNNDMPELNRRALVRSLKVRRGTIRTADGQVIARSVKGPNGLYRRIYPQGSLYGHPIGYSFVGRPQTEFEAAHNKVLMGEHAGLTTLWEQALGRTPQGDNVVTTLDSGAQKIATDRLVAVGGKGGAAVALDPRTGAVKVMASVPGYDPNTVRDEKVYAEMNRDEARKPLVNRALQFGYAPGSTFKVVTATAGVDSGRFDLSSTVDGDSGQKFSGVPLANDYGEDFGRVDLVTAMAKSVNTAWARVGSDLGKPAMRDYMERFGFGSKPELDYPRASMSASVIRPSPPGRPVPATSKYVDLGRLSIGQGGLDATPLQMAQVASAVAAGGRLMKPHLLARVTDSDGRTIDRDEGEEQATVMSDQAAGKVRDMMLAVVERGTGTKARIAGVKVAGKTGTAETEESDKINNVWFIGFAPADDPKVAVAVTVQGKTGFGGDFAAPIARDIMQELLR